MHEQDPADDRHDAVMRLMAENDKLKTEIARLESECRGWNAETKAGFFRQADYIRKYQEENDRLRGQIAQLRNAGDSVAYHLKKQTHDNVPMPAGYWQMLLDRMTDAGFEPKSKTY